jgi:hypothetical protein
MTIESLSAEVPSEAAVLAECDRLMGEVGRRHHLFSWLRRPEGGTDSWLEVDAYYPAQRLIVLCRAGSGEFAEVYRELVPRHGLRLLELDPAELSGDLRTELRDRLAALTPPSEGPRSVATSLPAPATAAGRLGATSPRVADRHAEKEATRRTGTVPARHLAAATHPRPATPATGLLIGLGLAAACGIEFYLGIAQALDRGHWLLAFGLALDLGARAIGTIVAARSGETAWAWACVIVGSPAVAACSLPDHAPVRTDPAPLAGVLGLLGIGFVVLGLVIG